MPKFEVTYNVKHIPKTVVVPHTTYEEVREKINRCGEVTYNVKQIPKTENVPQTVYEEVREEIKKPVYVTKTRTVRVPKTTYEEIHRVPYQEQVMERSIAGGGGGYS